MADGLDDPQGILRVGFLNESVDAKLENYKKLFDVVITNDGPMDWVLDLINQVLQSKPAHE
jgi:cytosolic 5'-nucleotidase 3